MATQKKKTTQRDYYKQLDEAIRRFENLQYPLLKISYISDKLLWCAKFKHLTDEQIYSLQNRLLALIDGDNLDFYEYHQLW